MNTKVDTKRVLTFIAFAFGLAWLTGLVIALTGGLQGGPLLIDTPVMKLNLAFLLLSTAYMFAPSIANVLTRVTTQEGWHDTMLRPRFKQGWRFWLAAWFLPGLLTIVGAVIFFVLFPRSFDPALSTLRALMTNQTAAAGAQAPAMSTTLLWTIALGQAVQGMLIAPLINGVFTFGEEFGWRGYLLPKLLPMGHRKAVIVTGLIWGVWHWPIIAMGYNYAHDITQQPLLGVLSLLAMCWFTVLMGVLLAWVTLRAGSVWPAVIGHGAINGIAALGGIFVLGHPEALLGPTPVGIVGSLAFTALAAFILSQPRMLEPVEGVPGAAPVVEAVPAEA